MKLEAQVDLKNRHYCWGCPCLRVVPYPDVPICGLGYPVIWEDKGDDVGEEEEFIRPQVCIDKHGA